MFNKKIITSNLEKMTKREKFVSLFLAEKGYSILNFSITSIVKDTNTSLGTVNRTLEKLGFNGFKGYKMYLFSKMNEKNVKPNDLHVERDNLLFSIHSLYDSITSLKLKEIAQLIEKNKDGILMIAEGFSFHAKQIFQDKLAKIFFDIKTYDEKSYAKMLNTKVLVIISQRLNSKTLNRKIKIVRKFNQKLITIAITNNPKIKSEFEYDHVLVAPFIDNNKLNSRELPSDSLVLLITLCNLLFDEIYKINEAAYASIIESCKLIEK